MQLDLLLAFLIFNTIWAFGNIFAQTIYKVCPLSPRLLYYYLSMTHTDTQTQNHDPPNLKVVFNQTGKSTEQLSQYGRYLFVVCIKERQSSEMFWNTNLSVFVIDCLENRTLFYSNGWHPSSCQTIPEFGRNTYASSCL